MVNQNNSLIKNKAEELINDKRMSLMGKNNVNSSGGGISGSNKVCGYLKHGTVLGGQNMLVQRQR